MPAQMEARQFHFHPPDRVQLWNNLALTMSQAVMLTGASERQIQHWMDRGYITPAAQGTRKINGESLDAILLIRQARAAGVPLGRAAEMARDYLASEMTSPCGMSIASTVVHEMHDRLRAARSSIDAIEDVISREVSSEAEGGNDGS